MILYIYINIYIYIYIYIYAFIGSLRVSHSGCNADKKNLPVLKLNPT